MPQPYKGARVKLTVRLPSDVHQEAAVRAAARRWDLSAYIAWCVENQINPARTQAKARRDPDFHATTLSPQGHRSRRRRGAFTPDITTDHDADPDD